MSTKGWSRSAEAISAMTGSVECMVDLARECGAFFGLSFQQLSKVCLDILHAQDSRDTWHAILGFGAVCEKYAEFPEVPFEKLSQDYIELLREHTMNAAQAVDAFAAKDYTSYLESLTTG